MGKKYTKRLSAFCLLLALGGNHAFAVPQSHGAPALAEALFATNGHQTMPSGKSLKDTLIDLRRTFGIQFSFKADLVENLDVQVPASPSEEKDVDLYLNTILTPNGLQFKKVNGVYIIYKKDSNSKQDKADRASALMVNDDTLLASNRLNSESSSTFAPTLISTANLKEQVAQEQALRGRIVDETGVGLPGVSVVLKGTGRGTTSDMNGNFTLTVPDATGTLVFSFIGYQQQEVPIGNRTTFDIALRVDAKALQEVVIVGYGSQRKEDVTGAIATISSEDFVPGQITTPEQLIQGKVAGVQITTNSGAPGAGSRRRIRGGASLDASNDPLIVIDGVPIDNAATSGAANPLNFLNPNDIASFNILKDASAAAIYGSRASNGVIIITTKKGEAGQRFGLNFSTQSTVAAVTNTVDVLSSDEYRGLINRVGTPSQQELLGSANTNWQDLIYRTAYTTDNNLSFSGSVKELPYRLSLGYLNQQGVLKTSNFERASVGLNLSPSFLDDHLRVNLNYKGALTRSRFADEGAIGAAVAFDPTQPVYAENNFGGYFQWLDANGNFNPLATRNPISMLEQRTDRGEAYRHIGNVQLDYRFHFLPDLRANLNLGFDNSNSDGSTVLPANFAPEAPSGGRITRFEQTKTNRLVDFYLNYVKDLAGLNSRIDVTAGYSFQSFENERPVFLPTNAAGVPFSDLEPGFPVNDPYRLKAYFGRINYSLLDRYVLTANIRHDGSSRFGADNRWGTFPSLAFAWRISEESFLKNSKALSDLKLRVGYGVTGQQDLPVSFFPYLARYTVSDNTAQYQLGNEFVTLLRPEGYDAGIKWEETRTWNAGLDFGFANNRVTATVDYFYKDTRDLLALIAIPAGTNLVNEIVTNVGNMDTRGLETTLNFNAISNERVNWNIGINGTYQTREITKLSRVEDPNFEGYLRGGISGGVGNNIQINSVGYAPNAFYVFKQVYNDQGMPIEGLYEDLNQDGVINESDKYRYKNPEPKFFLGFNSQLSIGKWDAGFVMRGSFGNYMYNNVYSNNGAYRSFSFPGYLTNVSSNVLDTNFEGFQLFSDYYMENASFMRMENINLGYNIGSVLNNKLNLRLNANIQNAFVITNYNGLDPEIATGIDNNFYPRPRMYTLGLNVTL